MPSRSLRWTAGLAVIAALIGCAAVPGAAAAKTRWVDDDGKAGPSTCAGSHAVPKKVQTQVTASAAGDVVRVCPGTYVGAILINGARDGLTVTATPKHGVILFPTGTTMSALVIIDRVDKVTLSGLAVRIPVDGTCAASLTGIYVSGAKAATIKRADIRPDGVNTKGACGINTGIYLTASTGMVLGGAVKDAKGNAVLIDATGNVTVDGLQVEYAHAGVAATSASGAMISVSGDARATIRNVTIAGIASAGVTTPQLTTGIDLSDAGMNVTIADVSISHAIAGVKVDSVATGLIISGVHVTDSGTALALQSGSGLDVSGTTVSAVEMGIDVSGPGVIASTIHDNDLTGATTGCRDETSGTGTAGTANIWTHDTGTATAPAGICTP